MGVGVMGSNIELYIEQFGWHHHQPWKLVKKSTLLYTVGNFIQYSIYKKIYLDTSLMSPIGKGQLISKCLFGVFNFFQKTKTNKNKLT